jgi:hypothetical protein
MHESYRPVPDFDDFQCDLKRCVLGVYDPGICQYGILFYARAYINSVTAFLHSISLCVVVVFEAHDFSGMDRVTKVGI